MGAAAILWLALALPSEPIYGEPSPEARGWIQDGVEPATVPQCGRTTAVALPAGWHRVDCRMGNLFLRNDRTGAVIRAHLSGPRFDVPLDFLKKHPLAVLVRRERSEARELDQHPGWVSLPVSEAGDLVYLAPADPFYRRFTASRDGQDWRGIVAAKLDLKDGRQWDNWLLIGRWPAAQDEAALRDFQDILRSIRCVDALSSPPPAK